MMYREVLLLPEKTMGDSGTETIDLDVTDPITQIGVFLKVTNVATNARRAIPTKIISKIELIDGGTVYASLSGVEAAGIAFYDTGHYVPCWYTEVPDVTQNVFLPLRFGRYLGDPLRNFDPTRLRNPQLKITWSKNALHLTGYVKMTVHATILDGVAGASSCLLTKAVREFTTASTGVEQTELPTDYPIRRLYVRPYLEDELPYEVVSNYKLDCDSGKFIPFDIAASDLIKLLETEFGYCWIRQMCYRESATFADSFLGRAFAGSHGSGDGGYITGLSASGTPYVYIHVCTHAGGSVDEAAVEINCFGSLPHYVHAIPFGLKDDPATWFNAGAFRKVVLSLTQGVASATCSILAQQDRPM